MPKQYDESTVRQMYYNATESGAIDTMPDKTNQSKDHRGEDCRRDQRH